MMPGRVKILVPTSEPPGFRVVATLVNDEGEGLTPATKWPCQNTLCAQEESAFERKIVRELIEA